MNKVLLLGNLGSDPELRFTGAGQAVLNFRVATNESWWDDKAQERKERVEWHAIVVWGKRAEALAKILHKGSGVMIEGSLRTSSYEKDGEKRYKTEIIAAEVYLTGGAPKADAPAPEARETARTSSPRQPPARTTAPAQTSGKARPAPAGVDENIPF